MAQATTTVPSYMPWPEFLTAKMYVLDFDKTITNKHTRGAVWSLELSKPEELQKNFADLDFLRRIIPMMKEVRAVAIGRWTCMFIVLFTTSTPRT